MKNIDRILTLFGLGIAFVLGACGSGEAAAVNAGSESVAAEASAPATTGTVITVKMITDDKGNYFEPATIAAKPGDVLRFELVSGVHNVSFPAGSNAGASGLPEASPYLQLPGQTHDLTVTLPAGEYAFQCDPHAALGMTGTLTVQ